ncbi:hypothetical protein ABIF86_000193 [Bradyrhizobium japonicum]
MEIVAERLPILAMSFLLPRFEPATTAASIAI